MKAPRLFHAVSVVLLLGCICGAYSQEFLESSRSGQHELAESSNLVDAGRSVRGGAVRLEETNDPDPIDAILQPLLAVKGSGFSILISVGDEVVKEQAYGLADVENDLPLTTASRTNVASVSKQFTGFLLVLMQRRGLLSLDDDVRKHVPEMPDYGATITLRHMIYMSSGIRDILNILDLGGHTRRALIPRDRLIQLITSQKRVEFAPGEKWRYSNSNYVLLAWIIEKVSGMSLPELLRFEIFEPLGMSDTTVYDDPTQIYRNLTQSYGQERSAHETGEFPSFELRNAKSFLSLIGTSSIISTPRDLLKWAKNFENSTLEGGQGLLEEILVPYVLPSNESDVTYAGGAQYAKGNFIHQFGNLTVIEHRGGIQGYRSFLIRAPELKTTIIIQGTSTTLGNSILPGLQIIEALHPGSLSDILESDEGSSPGEDSEAPVDSSEPDPIDSPVPSLVEQSKKPPSLDPGAYGQKAGVWTIAGPPASYFDMTSNCTGQVGAKRSCSLLINLGIFSKAYLHPEEELVWTGRILGVNGGITVTFDSADPHTASIKVKVPDVKPFEAVAVRDPKLQLTSEQLSKYEGQFYSEEVDAVYKARQDGYGLSFDVDAGIVDQPAYLPCCAESHFNGTFVESRPNLLALETLGFWPSVILHFSSSSDATLISVESSAFTTDIRDVEFKRIDTCAA